MTVEQYNILKEYENLLYTASQRNYVMFGSVVTKKTLSEIYSEVFNRKSNMMSGCGSCALNEMKLLANEYYEFEKSLQAQEETKSKVKKTRKKKEE